MIIYNREEKVVIIPEGNGSVGGRRNPCEKAIEEAYQDGYESGTTDGFATGYSSGTTDGYQEGYDAGIIADCGEAIEQAFEEGMKFNELVIVFPNSETYGLNWSEEQVFYINGNPVSGAVYMTENEEYIVSAITSATTLSTLKFGIAHQWVTLQNPSINGFYNAKILSQTHSGDVFYTDYELEFDDVPISYDKNAFDYGFHSGQTHPVNLYFPMNYVKVSYGRSDVSNIWINGVESDVQGTSWNFDDTGSPYYIALSASTPDATLNSVSFNVLGSETSNPKLPEELPYDPIINNTIKAPIVSQSRTLIRDGIPKIYRYTINFNNVPIYDEDSFYAGYGDKYEITIYYDDDRQGTSRVSTGMDIKLNGNDIVPIDYVFYFGLNTNKLLYDLTYLEKPISAITTLDIYLHILNGTAPDEILKIRVNGADFAISSQTKEYLNTEGSYSNWVFHIVGNITDIPPYGYFNTTSAKLEIYGLSGVTNNIEFSNFGTADVISTTNYSMKMVEDEYSNFQTEISANLKFDKFGNIATMTDNRFLDARYITILVANDDYNNDFSYWTNKDVYRLYLNGYVSSDGSYNGGIKIKPSCICDVGNTGTSEKLQIWFDGYIHC